MSTDCVDSGSECAINSDLSSTMQQYVVDMFDAWQVRRNVIVVVTRVSLIVDGLVLMGGNIFVLTLFANINVPGSKQWMYSVTFATDIECGIQIFWTVNRRAVSQWKIVKGEKDCGYRANNFSLGNGSAIHGSKDLNATFKVGGKSNWVSLLVHMETVLRA